MVVSCRLGKNVKPIFLERQRERESLVQKIDGDPLCTCV